MVEEELQLLLRLIDLADRAAEELKQVPTEGFKRDLGRVRSLKEES